MRSVIGYAAHLRVYQPLAAFPDDERTQWSAYVNAGDLPSRPVLMAREHEAGLTGAVTTPPRTTVRAEDQAYVRHLDGLTYVCPWRLQLRTWEALAEFRSQLPDELADAFVPGFVAEAAGQEHAAWLEAHPHDAAAILTSTWQVPIPWFVLFEPDERRLVLGERQPSGAPAGVARAGLDRALVYLTAMSRARRRVAKARAVVRRALGDGGALAAIEETGQWLEQFHPHSMVELDYGGLVHLLDDDTLSADTSVADIAQALDALGQGDAEAATQCYERVANRWRSVAALEHAN
jgi:hypothetical protein